MKTKFKVIIFLSIVTLTMVVIRLYELSRINDTQNAEEKSPRIVSKNHKNTEKENISLNYKAGDTLTYNFEYEIVINILFEAKIKSSADINLYIYEVTEDTILAGMRVSDCKLWSKIKGKVQEEIHQIEPKEMIFGLTKDGELKEVYIPKDFSGEKGIVWLYIVCGDPIHIFPLPKSERNNFTHVFENETRKATYNITANSYNDTIHFIGNLIEISKINFTYDKSKQKNLITFSEKDLKEYFDEYYRGNVDCIFDAEQGIWRRIYFEERLENEKMPNEPLFV